MSKKSDPRKALSPPDTTTPDPSKYAILENHGYRIGRKLGEGSYATVREASSTRHRGKVAVKVICKKKAPQDYLEKFLPREMDVVRVLKHPHVVLFLQAIETNTRMYLVMEMASRGDLLGVIKQRKRIPEAQAGVWFSQLVDGMDYCHQNGVVHRDLKCENVLLDQFYNLKITDFGFARLGMRVRAGLSPTLCETYCGSYAYAPPEILTGTPYVAQFADIWSMGVILFVMVFGRLPFDDSNHRELLRQVKRGPEFPERVEAATDCKVLIAKILVRRQDRVSINQIRVDPWYKRVSPTKEDQQRFQAVTQASNVSSNVVSSGNQATNTLKRKRSSIKNVANKHTAGDKAETKQEQSQPGSEQSNLSVYHTAVSTL